MKMKELARALDIPQEEYQKFRKTIKALLATGELVMLKRNRIGLPEELNVAVGTVQITRSGTGYLIREGKDIDLMLPPDAIGTALDGDKVMVRLTGHINGREAAAVIKVLERAPRNIVGVFRKTKTMLYVQPDNPRIHRDIYIPPDLTLGAEDGEKVVSQLVAWDDPHLNPEGKIIERIGFPGEPGVDMLTVIRGFGLPTEFPAQVLEEAERAAAALDDVDTADRLDLTKELVYTIDPEDAKDHDDAVSVERNELGYKLGVHIADVAHFVQEGSELDLEAFRRGNSVYLPGMVIPMLPEALSADTCSLKANKRRLAHSATIQFDTKGKMLSWTLHDTVIRSRAKLSYEEVQQFFDSGTADAKLEKVAENLKVARELATLLTKRRFSEGSLDFDLPEAKIVMNNKGEVLELGHRVRLESHRLVEEFMLAANRAVAIEMVRAAKPFLFRVHDKPDLEKLETFSQLMTRLGYKFPVSPNMKPVQIARFLDSIKNIPEEEFINELLLRSMKKAVYQRENIGHFGLAFTHYTHFTSPIRRYPDLMVHRLLRRQRTGQYTPAFSKRVESLIDHICKHCSESERTAESAERQAIKVKQVTFMANRLGEEYNGVISGVTAYGFFVRLENMGVEGLVRMSAIDDDYYLYDEKNYCIIGRRKNRKFRLGDAVRVGVQSVNTVRAEIDLFLPELKSQRRVIEALTPSKPKVKNHPMFRRGRKKRR
jgi:ribonuclease R